MQELKRLSQTEGSAVAQLNRFRLRLQCRAGGAGREERAERTAGTGRRRTPDPGEHPKACDGVWVRTAAANDLKPGMRRRRPVRHPQMP